MPDAARLLSQDHRNVEELFQRYTRHHEAALAEQICNELEVHTAIEEEVLYPRLNDDVPNGQSMRREAEHEHQEVKDLLTKIRGAGFDASEVGALMARVEAGVSHHVTEEESEVFPQMARALGAEDMSQLGAALSEAKQRHLNGLSGGPTPDREVLVDLTKQELYRMAQQRQLEGRSEMSKNDLINALSRP
jgi:iron-sulfur cluster repair protein YtfE (RIC family)